MTNLKVQKIQQHQTKKMPVLKAGMTIRVHQKIKEGEKERIQIFEGLVIKISAGYGIDKTFTVRKIVEGIGVEKIFPIHSPNVAKIEVIKKSKIRRSKLYYMRKLFGKSARLKGRFVSDEEKEREMEGGVDEEPEVLEEAPAVEAEAAPEAEEKPAETPEEPKPEEAATPEAPAEPEAAAPETAPEEEKEEKKED